MSECQVEVHTINSPSRQVLFFPEKEVSVESIGLDHRMMDQRGGIHCDVGSATKKKNTTKEDVVTLLR